MVLDMNPKYDFSILRGEEINLQCTVTNPQALFNVTYGSLVMTKNESALPGEIKNEMFQYKLTFPFSATKL